MSVGSCLPFAWLATTRVPLSQRAVAGASSCRPSCGRLRKAVCARCIAVATSFRPMTAILSSSLRDCERPGAFGQGGRAVADDRAAFPDDLQMQQMIPDDRVILSDAWAGHDFTIGSSIAAV